jgi:hypothetical protein
VEFLRDCEMKVKWKQMFVQVLLAIYLILLSFNSYRHMISVSIFGARNALL